MRSKGGGAEEDRDFLITRDSSSTVIGDMSIV